MNWVCESCHTTNGANALGCTVCGAVRRVPAVSLQPQAGARAGDAATSRSAGVGAWPAGQGAAGSHAPAPAAATSLGRSKIATLIVAAALVVGALVGALVAASNRDEPGQDDRASVASGPTDGTTAARNGRENGGGGSDADPLASDGDLEAATSDDPTGTTIAPATPKASNVPSPTTAPEQLLVPSSVTASCQSPDGEDAAGRTTSYQPVNLADGDPSSVWRCDGAAVGEWVELHFGRDVELTELGIIAGFNKIDPTDGTDRFLQSRRVASVRVELDDGSSTDLLLADERAMQYLPVVGKTGSARIVITGTRPGSTVVNDLGEALAAVDKTPIAEVVFTGRVR